MSKLYAEIIENTIPNAKLFKVEVESIKKGIEIIKNEEFNWTGKQYNKRIHICNNDINQPCKIIPV